MHHTVVNDSIEKMKNANIRITPQRYAILEYLVESKMHPTADEIYKALADRFPNMSAATVYNNLRLFVKIGFVKELAYGDASSRFDFSNTQHYHAICESCGKIVDLYYPVLDDVEMVAENLTGFQVGHHRMVLNVRKKGSKKKILLTERKLPDIITTINNQELFLRFSGEELFLHSKRNP